MDHLVNRILNHSIDDEPSDPIRTPDSSDDDENTPLPTDDRIMLPPRRGGPQTGPKGVLADAHYYSQLEREQEAVAKQKHNAKMLAGAPTTTTYREDEAQRKAEDALILELENASSDEEEIHLLRQRRLRELQRRRERFGNLMEINESQYVNAVEGVPEGVAVVVHIYENSIPQCRRLNECLAQLARRYGSAKFVRILAREVEFDVVGIPAVLIYRNGNIVANLVRIIDDLGDDQFDVETVEKVILKSGGLKEEDVFELQPMGPPKRLFASNIPPAADSEDDDY